MIYQKQTLSDPKLPFYLFKHHKTLSHPGSCLQNWHENIELLFFCKGEGEVSIDEQMLRVEAGDIVVINANRIHRVAPAGKGELDYHCIIIDRAFCLANFFDTNTLSFCPHFKDREMSAEMERLVEWYDLPDDTSFRAQNIRASALRILALLGAKHLLSDNAPPADTPHLKRIKRAIEFIGAQCHRDISLGEIAQFVDLSKFHFDREFRRITGYGLVEYVNKVRCERAKSLLGSTDHSIQEVGAMCGFSGRSYCTRVFTRYAGVSPSEYRKSSKL